MKTRSINEEHKNIAETVKARHIARSLDSPEINTADLVHQPDGTSEQESSSVPNANRLHRTTWSGQDRRLFFQALRIYGKNFTEITRYMHQRGLRNQDTGEASAGALNCGRTKDQVRFFYQQTWYKIRRFIKLPESIPQHVKEVYSLINYSVFKSRIKKPLDNRLGEKLTELITTGTTTMRRFGKTILVRTPVCSALKKLNNIAAPQHRFRIPEDVTLEIVPCSQAAIAHVVEMEQNPRLRLKVDVNRQLCDVIALLEAKWVHPVSRMCNLLGLAEAQPADTTSGKKCVALRLSPDQKIEGALELQEVARTRFNNICLRAYMERQSPCLPPEPSAQGPDQQREPTGGSGVADAIGSLAWEQSHNTGEATASHRLDLARLGSRLSEGVTYEAAREIKLVAVYVALGCPRSIRFQYDLVQLRETRTSDGTVSLHYTSAFLDQRSPSLSNGLRRLLHLNNIDYLNYKELLSSISSTQPEPEPPLNATVTTTFSSELPSSSQPPIQSQQQQLLGTETALPHLLIIPTAPPHQPDVSASTRQPETLERFGRTDQLAGKIVVESAVLPSTPAQPVQSTSSANSALDALKSFNSKSRRLLKCNDRNATGRLQRSLRAQHVRSNLVGLSGPELHNQDSNCSVRTTDTISSLLNTAEAARPHCATTDLEIKQVDLSLGSLLNGSIGAEQPVGTFPLEFAADANSQSNFSLYTSYHSHDTFLDKMNF